MARHRCTEQRGRSGRGIQEQRPQQAHSSHINAQCDLDNASFTFTPTFIRHTVHVSRHVARALINSFAPFAFPAFLVQPPSLLSHLSLKYSSYLPLYFRNPAGWLATSAYVQHRHYPYILCAPSPSHCSTPICHTPTYNPNLSSFAPTQKHISLYHKYTN